LLLIINRSSTLITSPQRRAPAVPPVPLDPSSSDDGYGDSDFDDFDDK